MPADDEGQLKVRVGAERRTRLRVAAALADRSVSEIVSEAIDRFFDGETRGGAAVPQAATTAPPTPPAPVAVAVEDDVVVREPFVETP